jgi:hypothetical protein
MVLKWRSRYLAALSRANNAARSTPDDISQFLKARHRALAGTSFEPWSHATAHRGSGASCNAQNQTVGLPLPSHPHPGTRTKPHSYREPPVERNCLVHAYSMLQGHKCLTSKRLQNHTRDILQQDDMYLHTVLLTPTDLCTTQEISPYIASITTA